jgi:two-component system, cell cycle sensor histidine kinase and response regulator CckA
MPAATEPASRVVETVRPPARRTDPTAAMAFPEREPRTNERLVTRLLNQTRNAEERYRALFESAHDAITILNTDGVVLEANPRWEAILGIPSEGMVGRHIREFAAPGSENENVDGFVDAVSKGEGRAMARLLRTDGESVLMEFSDRVVELNGRPVVFTIGRDVTETVRAAQALRTAEERYRSLVERIPDVIWTINEHGKLTFVTPNVASVLGFSVEEMCATSIDKMSEEIHPEDRTHVMDAWEGLMHHGSQFDVEYRRRSKNGRWVWLRNRAFASYVRDGVRYAEGMLSDITEKKQLEERLRLAQKMEAVGQLSAGIAHDFNNMLCAILTNSHFLIDDLPEGDPRRADAEEIKEIAERAATLTRQLLAFSRRQVLAPTMVDLNTSIAGLQKMLRRLIGEDIEFSIVRAPNLGLVRADAGQLEQVLMNLAVNARDAMPGGGKLSIETANLELREEDATSLPLSPGHYVTVTVSDTGIGMDTETKRRLFEPFFTTKETGRGTGLGLSTCYGIVTQSGGWIDVSSEPGQGAVFKVYLPLVNGASKQERTSLAAPAFKGVETVLLVEDDDRVRAAVCRVLESAGYSLLVARDGNEAVAVAERYPGPIHLLLSDMVMPGPSGPETVGLVQAHRPQTKVLFMSGYTDHSLVRSEAFQTSMNFIPKPFAPSALAKKIREVLNG